MKRCCTCKVEKEEREFGKHKGWSDGYRPQCKECRNSRLRTGKPNSGRFKKNQTPWNKGVFTTKKRKSRRHDNWSRKVKERDGNKCTRCGSHKNLHAHHIISWNDNEDLRFDISNGKTLCGRCHCILEPKLPKVMVAWNKGIKGTHFSPETEIKIGQRLSPKTEFKKGMIPWNKGMKNNKSEETKRNKVNKVS